MKRHAVLAQHTSEPRTTIEANGYLARLFQMGLDAPTLKLAKHPLRRILIGIRSDQAATEAVREDV